MKYDTLLISATVIGITVGSAVVSGDVGDAQGMAARVVPRGYPANAPNGYTPQTGVCPGDGPSIRNASTLSPNETAWLPLRRNATITPLQDLLSRLNITGLDTDQYISTYANNASALPNIGIAISGGGYRAMLTGAGVIEAFDNRTKNATAAGGLGGLLQSATYLSGLSGGNWLVGSIYANNFTSVSKIIRDDNSTKGSLWQFDNTIFEGPEDVSSLTYYTDLVEAVDGKSDAGFNTTITDYWGRALAYQLINDTEGGLAYTFSSVAHQDFFTNGSVPLPLLVADGRAPGEIVLSTNSTVFEFDPWEFGTFDPTVYGFAPLKFLGTNFSSGSAKSLNECVTGFDNMGFVMGTSSSLFNTALATINGTNTTSLFTEALDAAIEVVLKTIASDDEDIADYPNPFYGYHNDTNPGAQSLQLTLVDGGEDDQNIPLHPLLNPLRQVDVIFAVDSSADTNTSYPTNASASNWPDGASLMWTYRRAQSAIQNTTAFPSIPDTNTFINLGLNTRPTFFGCDASNTTANGTAPLIVYLPNGPYVYASNTSTLDLQYNDTERNAMVLNGYNLATQGNASIDSQWPTCVGCAILSRSLNRTGTTVPDVCTQCFDKYCWNGTTDYTAPGDFVPEMKLSAVSVTSGTDRRPAAVGLALASAFAVVVACL